MSKIKYDNVFSKILVLMLLIASCSGGERSKSAYRKTQVDRIITKYINEPNFSVILADMDYREEEKKYYHKYRIIFEKPKKRGDSITLHNNAIKAEDVKIEDMEWVQVSDVFFDDHIDDLGMTIVSKKNGVLDKKTSPAGYDNYVGNERYGRWQQHSSGSSFWVFYGQYRFLSDLFYGSSYRYYRSDYRDYDRNYRRNKNYYGSGTRKYGTNSSSAKTRSTWSRKSSAFRNKVRSSVKRSATTNRSRSYKSGSRYSRTSRNSSRYSNSSSTRSRSGGYGK